MERENRKRAREEDQEEERRDEKKPDIDESDYDHKEEEEKKGYESEFREANGVFDFPWLKEGVKIFNGDDNFDQFEDAFPPPFLDEFPTTSTTNFNLCDSEKKLIDDLWPFKVDDELDPLDCFWSSVIDQPLDVGFNKA